MAKKIINYDYDNTKLNAYITSIELYDETDEHLLATITAFDEASFTVKINNAIIAPEELRYIADILEKLNKEKSEYKLTK